MKLNFGRAAALAPLLFAAVALAAPEPRKQAEALLNALSGNAEAKRVAAPTMARAHDALRRADQMRKAGDQANGALLERAALEWASASSLLERTARTERELNGLQQQTTELETKAFRAQALIEQTIARKARAEENLRKQGEKTEQP